MSIKDFGEKIKGYSKGEQGKDLYIVILLIVVACTSFGLGRLSLAHKGNSAVSLVYPRGESGSTETLNQPANSLIGAQKALSGTTNKPVSASSDAVLTNSNLDGISKQIVASSRGSKYYYIWCSGAKNLSEANKIYFATEAEAEAKGYSKSTSCK